MHDLIKSEWMTNQGSWGLSKTEPTIQGACMDLS